MTPILVGTVLFAVFVAVVFGIWSKVAKKQKQQVPGGEKVSPRGASVLSDGQNYLLCTRRGRGVLIRNRLVPKDSFYDDERRKEDISILNPMSPFHNLLFDSHTDTDSRSADCGSSTTDSFSSCDSSGGSDSSSSCSSDTY